MNAMPLVIAALALRNRIDSDLEFIFPDQKTPTGDALLDEVLDWIIHSPRQETITYWIIKITERSDMIRQAILEELLRKNIIKVRQERVFLGFRTKKYPMVIGHEIMEIKSAEEKMNELVEEMKSLWQITNEEDLPEWLRKGTDQYLKTLSFIEETGTNEIIYNAKTGKYGLKIWMFPGI